jgi:hypothetical protein
LIVKNGINLIDYTMRLEEEDVGRRDTIVRAGTIGLRPILMTTLCTCSDCCRSRSASARAPNFKGRWRSP